MNFDEAKREEIIGGRGSTLKMQKHESIFNCFLVAERA